MKKRIASLSPRTKWRLSIMLISGVFLTLGMYFEQPWIVNGQEVFRNTFQSIGIGASMIGLGLIELVKVWRGEKT